MALVCLAATSAAAHNYGENGICTDAGCTAPYQPATLSKGYYQLANAGNVEWFAAQVNKGGDNMFLNAVLTADIDMSGVKHTPIGNTEGTKFNGTFDGQGHRIMNMIIGTSDPYQGFFGLLRGGGTTISNLIIDKSCRLAGGVRTGGIAGGAQTVVDANRPIRIINCGNEAAISVPTNGGGGIMGASLSPHPPIQMINCYNAGSVTGTTECAALVGWMGDNAGCSIQNCFNMGIVKGMDNSHRNLFRHANLITTQNIFDVSQTTVKTQGMRQWATDDPLRSGELCWMLNGDQTDIQWRQTLGSDERPTLSESSKRVYASGTLQCDGTVSDGDALTFSNQAEQVTMQPHVFEHGYCQVCGAKDETYDHKTRKVFLMGGQSNADGRADVSTMPQYIQDYVTNGGSKFCYWSYCHGSDWSWNTFGGKLVPYQPYTDNNTTARCGFDGVVYHFIEEALRERFYVIKESLGGTAIDTRCSTNANLWWCADAEWLRTASPRSGHSLAKELAENISLCIDNTLAGLKEGYEIQCMMWHQGEADRTRGCDYAKNLRQLVEFIRAFLVEKTGEKKYATLPFIAGTVNRRSTQYNIAVEGALYQLEDEDPNFHVVDFSDCALGSDNLHFNAEGNVTCASRMFNKLVHLGLLEADTIAVTMPEPDTLRLTKTLITNYDFEFYTAADGILLNDGTERRTEDAPYGWQHTWKGYPETPFPSSSSPTSFGLKGGTLGISRKSCAFYSSRGPMPEDFELSQTIPAGTLQPGRYRVSCLMGQNLLRAGVTRMFANNTVQYYGPEARYDADNLRALFPDETVTFAGWRATNVDELKEMSVTLTLAEGEDLRFGIRSSNLNMRGATTAINETGYFTTDFWRIVRLEDATGIDETAAKSRKTATTDIYDLAGRKLKSTPGRGIYVVNGQKVVR